MVGSSLNALPSSLDCILHSISVFLLWQQFAELCLLTTTMRIYSPVLKCGNSPFDDFPIKDIKASKKNRGFPIATMDSRRLSQVLPAAGSAVS